MHLECNPRRLVRNQRAVAPFVWKANGEFAADSTRWCSHTSTITRESWLAGQPPFAEASTELSKECLFLWQHCYMERLHWEAKEGRKHFVQWQACPREQSSFHGGLQRSESTKSWVLQEQVHKGEHFCILSDEKKFLIPSHLPCRAHQDQTGVLAPLNDSEGRRWHFHCHWPALVQQLGKDTLLWKDLWEGLGWLPSFPL